MAEVWRASMLAGRATASSPDTSSVSPILPPISSSAVPPGMTPERHNAIMLSQIELRRHFARMLHGGSRLESLKSAAVDTTWWTTLDMILRHCITTRTFILEEYPESGGPGAPAQVANIRLWHYDDPPAVQGHEFSHEFIATQYSWPTYEQFSDARTDAPLTLRLLERLDKRMTTMLRYLLGKFTRKKMQSLLD